MSAGVVGVGTVSGVEVVGVVGPLSALASVYGGLSVVDAAAVVVDEGSGGGTAVNISGV